MNGSGPVASSLPSIVVAPGSRFTPVRRPEQIKLAETPETAKNNLWTTARCKRLLRPISSRLALLKKQNPGVSESGSLNDDCYHNKTVKDANKDGLGATGWTNSSSGIDKRDPEWDPEEEEGRKKRLKRTYSSKMGSSNTKKRGLPAKSTHIQSASVQLPSPLVSQRQSENATCQPDRGDDPRSSGIHTSFRPFEFSARNRVGYPWTSKANPRDKFRRLAKSIAPLHWMVYDGLYNALNTLLTNTAKSGSGFQKGAPSLFSMCLKKLPTYVAEEQARAEEENPDEPEDVATFMYNELETFSKAKTSMRQVVRAHGILLFCEAIEGGFIAPAIAQSLVILCLQNAAYSEAESIVASMIDIMTPVAKPTSTADKLFSPNTSPALQALGDISLQTHQYKFLFRQLSALFAQGDIPMAWLSSPDMIEVWNQALRAITQNQGDCPEAMALCRTVLKQCYCSHENDMFNPIHAERTSRIDQGKKLKNLGVYSITPGCHDEEENALIATITNILTVLFSVVYAKNLPSDFYDLRNINASTSLHLLRSLASDSSLAMYFSDLDSWQGESIPRTAGFVYIPTLFIRICSSTKFPFGVDLSDPLPFDETPPTSSNTNTLDILSTLLCSIAQCCSRIASTSPFTIIKHMTEAIQSLPPKTPTQIFLSQLAVSTAFEFAETSMRQEHLDWALRVEDACTDGRDELGRTPGRTASAVKKPEHKSAMSFRWEDSICEWVARTPAPTKARAMAVKVPVLAGSRSLETSQNTDNSSPLAPSSPLERPSSVSSEVEGDEISLLAPSQILLSDLSPLVVISRASASYEEIQDEIIDEGHESKRTTLMRFRPRGRLGPRRELDPVYYDTTDWFSELDSQDETSQHASPALRSNKEPHSPLDTIHSTKARYSVEVHVPISSSTKREIANDRFSQASLPQPGATQNFEVRIPSSQILSRAEEKEREKLQDITNRALAVGKSPPKQQLRRVYRKRLNKKPTDQVDSSSLDRVLRPRRQIDKPVRNRIRAGQGRWSLLQASGNTSAASRGSFVTDTEGEESSEDELGL
ncbi:hypothetical protein MMC10_000085 [Thelotrema lepadinum]|nr:hypothetical protein [Thelotrema lepadinum]